jgi:tetratricopeptide (TPR) repeat protein/transcriptional regulator with XRE-family HTH domain
MSSQPMGGSVGRELRRLRLERGISQVALARQINYTKSYLSKVESGLKQPTAELARLCDEALQTGGLLARLVAATSRSRRRPGTPPPAQLPPQRDRFVGRETELSTLDAVLGLDGYPVLTIVGPAGVGKTALAVRWAQRVRRHFPDGVLFANLRGHDALPPLRPADVLDGFLRALGVAPAAIPPQEDVRGALLRTLLDGRRVLIVLDNAADSSQVRPLLPGTQHCLAVVTSRNRLSGLVARDLAEQVTLPLLPAEDAVALLRDAIGSPRVDAEAPAAAELARRCAYLPLALRIAAERAVTHPRLPLAELVAQLADGRDRLGVLAADEEATAVRAVLSWSYAGLSTGAAYTMRMLGLFPGRDMSVRAAAAMSDRPASEAARWLRELADVHLIDHLGEDAGVTLASRYSFHDLLREYAADCALREETDAVRGAAIDRVLGWYLDTAERAAAVLRSAAQDGEPVGPEELPLSTYDEVLAWYGAERANLVSAVDRAAERELHTLAWRLAAALSAYFHQQKLWSDWVHTHEVGLVCARKADDAAGEARMLSSLGAAVGDQGRYEESLSYLDQALEIRRRIGDHVFEAYTLNNIGQALWQLGRHDEGLARYREAVTAFRRNANTHGLASGLNNLGSALSLLGSYDEAMQCLTESLSIQREAGNRYGEGMVLDSLGELQQRRGEHALALELLREALSVRHELGDRFGAAYTLITLGDVVESTGAHGEARQHWREAVAILDELDAPYTDDVRERLAR